MGSFCITAWSPAAGRQKLDIGSGNPIGTIREGKLKSRGVCSPIRQGSSRRRRGRRAKVNGAQTSQRDLVHLCDIHIHVACLQIHQSIFFFVKITIRVCSDHSTYVVKTVGFCQNSICWGRFFCKRCNGRSSVSHTDWNLGFFFFANKYTYSQCDYNSWICILQHNISLSVNTSEKPQSLYF